MNVVSMWVRSISGRSALVVSMLVLLAISSAAQAVDNVQSRFAGADAGDWGGSNGAVIGPPDGACANMGAAGNPPKINLVSGFNFDLPSDATVTGITAFAKAGENGPQSVDVQIATNATVNPATTVGNALQLSVPGTGGACSATEEIDVGTTIASWGISDGELTFDEVNSPNFGMIFTKTEASSIKVDSVCMNVAYTTPEGNETTEDCFEVVTPEANGITVVKEVIGASPGSDWDFDAVWDGPFTLPAGGGFQVFGDLTDGLYTISETTKEGYVASVQCFEGETQVASGTDSVQVDLDNAGQREDFSVTCIFTNAEILPPPPITRATFQVTKDFTDDNTRTASVTISCDTGLPLEQSWDVSEAAGVTFVVESFESGAMDCDVTEAAVPGYTAVSYVAGGTGTGSNSATNALKCTFGDVGDGDAKTCAITNEPTPVQVSVHKDWIIDGEGGDQVDPYYCIELSCGTSEILGGWENDGYWTKNLYCSDSNGTSNKTYTAHVVPDWHGNTACSVNGEVVADDSVESDNGCASGALKPVIGGGGTKNACTITNTVFFEGIPTLSQYGMAIMALLMLGVGFVGFRRFV